MTFAFICAFIYYQFKYRHFKIVKATSRKWLISRKDNVVTYRIQILTKRTSDELRLEELHVGDKVFKVRVLKKESNSVAQYFAEKETLYLEAERETKNVSYEEMRPSRRAKVSLSYTINNKRKYLSIKNFEESDSKPAIAANNNSR
jgi:hypothetical protein